jgi:GNAT superfamily N-acetyltransferase
LDRAGCVGMLGELTEGCGMNGALEFHPLTAERWVDLETLCGPGGAGGGGGCMWWRLTRSQFEQQKGEGNRAALLALVLRGEVPGILAYAAAVPVGWCAVAARETLPALDRSRSLKRVDDQPVWSVACFFIPRQRRRQGLSVALLRAAVEHARAGGARIVEGYPVEPQKKVMPDVFAWTGAAAAFRKVGFVEVARRSPTRPIMRLVLGDAGPG